MQCAHCRQTLEPTDSCKPRQTAPTRHPARPESRSPAIGNRNANALHGAGEGGRGKKLPPPAPCSRSGRNEPTPAAEKGWPYPSLEHHRDHPINPKLTPVFFRAILPPVRRISYICILARPLRPVWRPRSCKHSRELQQSSGIAISLCPRLPCVRLQNHRHGPSAFQKNHLQACRIALCARRVHWLP